jgi:glycosyltransferase involved in cell wall biosynthesis
MVRGERWLFFEVMTIHAGGAAHPEVSVVVPTHNRRELLLLTLRSVLWQRGVDVEVIVVDDGSTDGTRDAVLALHEPRVHVVDHRTAQGVSVARNRGFSASNGRWVAFLDDDDLWAPDKLIAQLDAAKRAGRDWVYTGAVNINDRLEVLGGAPPEPPDNVAANITAANLVPGGCSGVLIRRPLLTQEPFDQTYFHFADWDLWIRLAEAGPPAWVPRPLVGYRLHGGNASHDTDGMIAELDIIARRYGGKVDRARFYRHVARVSLRGSRPGRALRYYYNAARRDGRYARREFGGDLAQVGVATLNRSRAAIGRRVGSTQLQRPLRWPGADAHARWRDEATQWLTRLDGGSE